MTTPVLTSGPQLDDESDTAYIMRKVISDMVTRAATLHEVSFINDANEGAYGVSLTDACEIAANEAGMPLMADMIYFVLKHAWNDALMWATGESLEAQEDK